MLNFFKKKKSAEESIKEFYGQQDLFNKQLRLTRVILCEELFNELKQNYSDNAAELVRFLSARIVNYLIGEDNDLSYKNADEDSRKKIDLISDEVKPSAHRKLKRDKRTRELVVYTLRMRSVFEIAAEGKAYINSDKHKRIVELLETYGADFPKEADSSMYTKIVSRYHQERFRPLTDKK